MRILCLLCLYLYLSVPLNAQFTWSGNTADFIISDQELQLNAEAESSEKSVFTSSEIINNATWLTTVEMQFNPSSSNYCRLYLVSDRNSSDIQNGYFVECGSTDDDIKLYRVLNGSSTVLIDGKNDRLDKSPNVFTVKVTKDERGTFTLYYKDDDFSGFVPEGTATDMSIPKSMYFGIHCTYTSTRSRLFSFSNISITGDAYIDSIPPALDSARVYNSNTIHLYFNEPVKSADAELNVDGKTIEPESLIVNGNLLEIGLATKITGYVRVEITNLSDLSGNIFSGTIQVFYREPVIEYAGITGVQSIALRCNYPPDINRITADMFTLDTFKLHIAAGANPNLLSIHTMLPILPDKPYTFSVTNMPLANGDTITAYDTILKYHIPLCFDVVISEVMADPTPSLAYGHEYIELYNRSDYAVDISGWKLMVNATTFVIPDFMLASKSFMVFTDGNLSISNQVVSSKFPSITNSSCSIELQNRDGTSIDYLEYNSSSHAEPFKEDGGWSLERMDPGNFQTVDNWGSCLRDDGGTPGQPNSLNADNPDLDAPFIVNLYPISATRIELTFNEPVQELNQHNIRSSHTITSLISQKAHTLWTIEIKNKLSESDDCEIELSNINDFNDNCFSGAFSIAMPGKVSAGDLIINELMTNPLGNEPEYVELYNASDAYLNASDLRITKRNDDGMLESLVNVSDKNFLIPPGAYVVISKSGLQGFGKEFPKTNFVASDMYTLPNETGSVVVTTATGYVIDDVSYEDSWHLSSLIDAKGISLERISPDISGNDPHNWTSAGTLPSSSTPGSINSQFRDLNELNNRLFSISDDYFTPNGDGDRDVLWFRVQHVDEYLASVQIFNSAGRPVKTICNANPGINISRFSWNGTDNTGSLCSSGIYIVYFTLTSSSKSEQIKKVVSIGL